MQEFLRQVIHATTTVFVTAFGAALGSFANVVIYRVPRHLSVARPIRSFCPNCGSTILWYDNIPILSYLLLRARCRFCKAPISARYILVEALCAASFGLAGYLLWREPLQMAYVCLFALCAVVLVFVNLRHGAPDTLLAGLFLLVLLIHFTTPEIFHRSDWSRWLLGHVGLDGTGGWLRPRLLAAGDAALSAGAVLAVAWPARLVVGALAPGAPPRHGTTAVLAAFAPLSHALVAFALALVAALLLAAIVSAIRRKATAIPVAAFMSIAIYILLLRPDLVSFG